MTMLQNEKEHKLVIKFFGKDIQCPYYLHSIDYFAFNDAIASRLARRKYWEKRKEEEYAEEVKIAFNARKSIQEKNIQESHSIKRIQENGIQLGFNIQ